MELPLLRRCAAWVGGRQSLLNASWCEGFFQLLELHCRDRSLLRCRGILMNNIRVRAGGVLRTAGRRVLLRFGSGDHSGLGLWIRLGSYVLHDWSKRRWIVDPVQHSPAAYQDKTLRIHAELLQLLVKLLKSLLGRSRARDAARGSSRGRVLGGCCDRGLTSVHDLRAGRRNRVCGSRIRRGNCGNARGAIRACRRRGWREN